MSDSLPPDFDANWYAANYRDVALSGLSSKQHYLRFGRLLGRKVSASAARAAGPAAATTIGRVEQRDRTPVPSNVSPRQPKANMSPPIIDRPDGFDAAEAVPRPAPPRPGSDSKTTIALDEI